EAGIKTTCFISPIFPGITDVEAIVEQAKDRCNLVWLENLNLRGDYRVTIMNWIHENHPELDELYYQIYSRKNREYWNELDSRLRVYAEDNDMPYIRAEDSQMADFGEPPVMVNYFYHEEVKKSARKKAQSVL
ncbi:MAG: radical SAM mobile pair protein B, partial [Anaerovibrio sp.]|nr:radical SAM mobile pair protein B [Anaerovibrio sp.]